MNLENSLQFLVSVSRWVGMMKPLTSTVLNIAAVYMAINFLKCGVITDYSNVLLIPDDAGTYWAEIELCVNVVAIVNVRRAI